jgi:hypothetical protein
LGWEAEKSPELGFPELGIERHEAVKDSKRQAIRRFKSLAGKYKTLLELHWDRLAFEVWRDKYAYGEVAELRQQ